MGAKSSEWIAGGIAFFVAAVLVGDPARQLPFLLLGMVAVAQILAYVRITFVEKRKFSDVTRNEPSRIKHPGLVIAVLVLWVIWKLI